MNPAYRRQYLHQQEQLRLLRRKVIRYLLDYQRILRLKDRLHLPVCVLDPDETDLGAGLNDGLFCVASNTDVSKGFVNEATAPDRGVDVVTVVVSVVSGEVAVVWVVVLIVVVLAAVVVIVVVVVIVATVRMSKLLTRNLNKKSLLNTETASPIYLSLPHLFSKANHYKCTIRTP